MTDITWDIEGSGLLDDTAIDYTCSPYKLKDSFEVHCIVVENHKTGEIFAFYDGPKIVLDGTRYEVQDEIEGNSYTYILEEYESVEYIHFQLNEFPNFISQINVKKVVGHNTINYDHLVMKLYAGMDYSIADELDQDDNWAGHAVTIEDTLVISKTLNPDRWGGHSLDNLAKLAGKAQKSEFRKHIPIQYRFKTFAPDMLHYNIFDVKSNTAVYHYLESLKGKTPEMWDGPILLEKQVAEIVTRQSHRGFAFNKDLAEEAVEELDGLMKERRERVDPLLPPRKATKAFLDYHTPSSSQVLITEECFPKAILNKNTGLPSANLAKFVMKHAGEIDLDNKVIRLKGKEYPLGEYQENHPLSGKVAFETRRLATHFDNWLKRHGGKVNRSLTKVKIYDKVYSLPMESEPIKTEMVANIEDTTHIKGWLVELGWNPTEWASRDITLKTGTKIKRNKEELETAITRYVEETLESPFWKHRCSHLGANRRNLRSKIEKKCERYGCKVLTTPKFTIGQDKELCPSLEAMSEQFPYAKDIVEYLTYRHRRNTILGGNIGWDEVDEAEKGYLANIREDGRIPTPADTQGCSCVVADTLIISDKGTVPIIDVGIGDLVLTHSGVYGKVTDRIENGIKPTKRLTFSQGNEVVCTYNHPFLTPDGWKKAEELKEKDEVYFYQEEEKWSKIPNYSRYLISSWGRILGQNGKQLKMCPRKTLWERASLDLIADNGKKRRWGIGPLVLEAFVEPRPQGKECCHKDGNPCNNFLNNLYWGTSKENSADAKLHGKTLKASRQKSKLTQKQIDTIKQTLKEEGHYRGQDGKIAKQYGVSREYIRDIRLGRRWREGNTVSIYKEEFKLGKVTKIEDYRDLPTYDITVEDHHSYLANAIVCHNTSRFTHKIVANVPRPSSLYGEKLRGLFTPGDNCYQIGYDFPSLEARVEAHFCDKYDEEGKPYCKSLLQEKPFDVHSLTAKVISEKLGIEFSRTNAKSVRYCLAYGGSFKRISQIIGCDDNLAKTIYDLFWEAAAPLDKLRKQLEIAWESKWNKKYVKTVDGRFVPTRSKHSLVNSLFQSAGAICAKQTMVFHDRLLRDEGLLVDFFKGDWKTKPFTQQMIMYHDEIQFCSSKETLSLKSFSTEKEAKEFKDNSKKVWSSIVHKKGKYFIGYSRAAELATQAVRMTEDKFKLKVDLCDKEMEWDLGFSWAECH